MEDAARDAFLACLIAELDSQKDSTGGFEVQARCTIDEVLQKFSYDFPLLEEEHIAQLAAFLLSIYHRDEQDLALPRMQFLTGKFVENVSYLASSASYGQSASLPELCGALYVSLPLACLDMTATELEQVFATLREDDLAPASLPREAVLGGALRHVFDLLQSSTPHLLLAGQAGAEEEGALSVSTAEHLCALTCSLLRVLAAPVSTPPSPDGSQSLQRYLSARVQDECNQVAGEEEAGSVVSVATDALNHLMNLIRDLVTISPALYSSLMVPVTDTALAFVNSGARRKIQGNTVESLRGVLTSQIQTLLFHNIGQISSSFYSKFSPSPRGVCVSAAADRPGSPYATLVRAVRNDMAGIVSVVDCIEATLKAEASDDKKYILVMDNTLSSLAAAGLVLAESFSAVGAGAEAGAEQVFLESQLLPLLMRTAFRQRGAGRGDGSQAPLYSLVSGTTRRQVMTLLAVLALMSTESGTHPFAPFVCQTVHSVWSAMNASTGVKQQQVEDPSAAPDVNDDDVLLRPPLLGCMFAGVLSSAWEGTSQFRKSAQSPAPSVAYSTALAMLSADICFQINELNQNCCKESNDDSDLTDVTRVCTCTKAIFHKQTHLNALLDEVQYMLWTLRGVKSPLSSLAPATPVGGPLREFIRVIGAAITELKANATCPAAKSTQCNTKSEVDLTHPATSGNAFNDMVIRGELDDAVNVRGEGTGARGMMKLGIPEAEDVVRGAAAWRGVQATRNRHIHGVLKLLKVLTATIAEAADSKTD